MTKEELYLKTIFCCIACDGDIATEEVGMVRELCAKDKFFKKIRSRLTVSDEAILAEHPDKEDFLLPDINIAEAPQWDDNIHFSQITIPTQTN